MGDPPQIAPEAPVAAAEASPALPPPAARSAEIEPAAAAVEPVSGDVETWRRLAEQLGAENRRLQTALASCGRDVERHRAGVQRCVDELNQQAAGRPWRAPPAPRAEKARVSTLGAPQVQILGDAVLVTGRLWNRSDVDAYGILTVELLRDGQLVEAAEQRLDVPAHGDVAYSHHFAWGLSGEGTYSGRVRVEVE
ncbi:MAG TPA: hypothetical protein VMT16_09885 [Thermoanaerobaculia bacterium]|nr:hypothetical protein [Thermoanaerobaculia bacterium]